MLFTDLSLLHFPDSTRNLFHPYSCLVQGLSLS